MMRKKTGFIKLIRLWGVGFLTALATVIVGIDLVANYHDFNIHVDNMRRDYFEQQKQASKREVERIVNMISHEREQSEALAKKEIKSRVFEAFSIVQNIYKQNRALKSDVKIRKMIVDALKPIRFNDGTGYFFIHSLSGENIFDPTHLSSEGQNIINMKDSRGEYVVKKELELLSEKDEGFLIGYWPKPGRDSTKYFNKITFVKIFKPYNWSIGAGLYVDDIEEQIKATWMERINTIRFGKNLVGYLFVDDWQGKSLAHGAQPDLIGTDMWETKDSRGNKTTQLLVAASKKEDGGYASFWWRKPDTGLESLKIVYAKAVPEWELLVGSGVYVDDIEENITTLRAALNGQTKRKVLIFITVVAMAFALFFILFHLLSNQLRKDFNLFVSFFDQAAFSDKKIDRETVQFVELDQMAESTNKMITDRQKAEEEIHSAKLFIDRVVDMSPFAMWISDRKGTVIRTNSSLRETLNLTDDKIVGHYNVLKDKNMEIQGVMPEVIAVFEKHEPANFSIPWKAASAAYVNFTGARDLYINVSIFPIVGAEGELTNTVCQWVNITEDKQVEEELRNSEEKIRRLNEELEQRILDRTTQLVASNKELEAFAYSVSHDLRAPLRAISGFSQMLVEDYADKLDTDGQRQLKVVQDSAGEMGQLIDGLLAFSRIGRTKMKHSPINMESLVEEAFVKLQESLKSTSAKLIVKTLPAASCDRILLHTVFTNLLSNSIKFAKPGRPTVIEVTGSVEENENLYLVKDNGVGFDMKYVDKIFQVFQRLHSVKEFEGTGIGLALVQRIISRHGGRVWAEGKVDEGVTIYFTIPR